MLLLKENSNVLNYVNLYYNNINYMKMHTDPMMRSWFDLLRQYFARNWATIINFKFIVEREIVFINQEC